MAAKREIQAATSKGWNPRSLFGSGLSFEISPARGRSHPLEALASGVSATVDYPCGGGELENQVREEGDVSQDGLGWVSVARFLESYGRKLGMS